MQRKRLPSNTRRVLGHLVKKLRDASGLTQTELGSLTGIPMQRVSAIERGVAQPRAAEVEALTVALPALAQLLHRPKRLVQGIPLDRHGKPVPPVLPHSTPPALNGSTGVPASGNPITIAGSPELLRVREAAAVLGASTYMVRSLISSGTLPGLRLGRLLRVRRDDLRAFVNGQAAPETQ